MSVQLSHRVWIEKLAQILSEYGLSDEKAHHINIRLAVKDGDLFIGMRDDCKLFNIAEYEQLLQSRDEKEMSPACFLRLN